MPLLSRRGFLGLTAAGAAVTLAGCGSGAAPAGAGRTIRTCVYARNHASAPLFWQRFAPEGVTVEVSVVTSSAQIQQGLEAGRLDFGLIGPYSTIVGHLGDTMHSKIVGMVARQGIGLVGRAGVVTDVADLAGRKVAVPPPGQQVLMLTVLLDRAGLALGRDVEGVPLAYADHPAALERGDVDAYIGTEPLCTQSVVAGIGSRLTTIFDTPIGDFNTALWASPSMLRDPEMCRLGASMQKQAAEYLSPGGVNDRAAWRDLLVEQFGYEQAIYDAVLENVGAEWRFDAERVSQVEGAGAVMARTGVIDREPDYEALYAREYWDI